MYSFTASSNPGLIQNFTNIYPSSLNATSFMIDIAVSGQQFFLLENKTFYHFTINQSSGSVMNFKQYTIENPASSIAVVQNGYFTNIAITQVGQILELFLNNQNGKIIGNQTYRNVLIKNGTSQISMSSQIITVQLDSYIIIYQ